MEIDGTDFKLCGGASMLLVTVSSLSGEVLMVLINTLFGKLFIPQQCLEQDVVRHCYAA